MKYFSLYIFIIYKASLLAGLLIVNENTLLWLGRQNKVLEFMIDRQAAAGGK